MEERLADAAPVWRCGVDVRRMRADRCQPCASRSARRITLISPMRAGSTMAARWLCAGSPRAFGDPTCEATATKPCPVRGVTVATILVPCRAVPRGPHPEAPASVRLTHRRRIHAQAHPSSTGTRRRDGRVQHACRHDDTVFGRGIKPEHGCLQRVAHEQRVAIQQRVPVGRAVGLLIVRRATTPGNVPGVVFRCPRPRRVSNPPRKHGGWFGEYHDPRGAVGGSSLGDIVLEPSSRARSTPEFGGAQSA
jgi:hypothetical protein